MRLQRVVCVDQNVVHVDRQPSLSQLFYEDFIHHHLEGRGGVGKLEEHDIWFELSFVGYKGRLPLVSIFDADVVIPPSYVELGEDSGAFDPCYEFQNQWERVSILYHPFVDLSVVLYQS